MHSLNLPLKQISKISEIFFVPNGLRCLTPKLRNGYNKRMLPFFRRRSKPTLPDIERERKGPPEGLWFKCDGCGEMLYRSQLEKNLWVCPHCGHHFRIGAGKYKEILLDNKEFDEEIAPNLTSLDPLGFPDYKAKIEKSMRKTGLKEAAIAGVGRIGNRKIVLFITDFGFIGGSMGSVVGEKFYRAARKAIELKVPMIAVTASGGGARMHEGIISLMQMVKTSLGVLEMKEAGIPYIVVLTHPTMGGVMASFASLGDVLIAEPKALLGFAGPRVIRDTIKQELPEGFQRSEFLLEHGMVDMVLNRKELKDTIIRILDILEGN